MSDKNKEEGSGRVRCPYCQNDDPDMMDMIEYTLMRGINSQPVARYFCKVCSKTFEAKR